MRRPFPLRNSGLLRFPRGKKTFERRQEGFLPPSAFPASPEHFQIETRCVSKIKTMRTNEAFVRMVFCKGYASLSGLFGGDVVAFELILHGADQHGHDGGNPGFGFGQRVGSHQIKEISVFGKPQTAEEEQRAFFLPFMRQ